MLQAFANIFSIPDLRRRVFFTLGMIAIYRLGFVIPLATVTSNSLNIADMAVWSVVALVVQLAAFFAVRVVKPNLAADIEAGKTAPAVSYAAFALGTGILNAACMT